MIKLPHKLTKRTLMMYLKKEYAEEDKEIDEQWDSGYDAALENIGQKFLTDEELKKVFHCGK